MFTKKTDKKIFAKGGRATYAKYGRDYMKMIGLKGGRPKGSVKKPTSAPVDKPTIQTP